MRSVVVVFPGSNCDNDVAWALEQVCRSAPVMVWHRETSLPPDTDLVVLPGGFTYGDYLRPGAMAARAPLMRAVADHAQKGGLVLGICNGFQVLTEARLLPGALLANDTQTFLGRDCLVRVERTSTPFTGRYEAGQVLRLPIAHNEGLYYLPQEPLDSLDARGQVVLRYCTPEGEATGAANPNGSLHNIAGIVNDRGNVMGLMPHPERAVEGLTGGTDGIPFWESVGEWLQGPIRGDAAREGDHGHALQ